jgi:hypothetical protein
MKQKKRMLVNFDVLIFFEKNEFRANKRFNYRQISKFLGSRVLFCKIFQKSKSEFIIRMEINENWLFGQIDFQPTISQVFLMKK